MDKETAWSLFETTGNIDAYMLYHDLADDDSLTEIGEDHPKTFYGMPHSRDDFSAKN